MGRSVRSLASVVFLLLGSASLAQGPQNVLLVVNGNSRMSRAVADYYQQRRGIPPRQLCIIRAPEAEDIERDVFDKQVRRPVLECLKRNGLQDRILYVVLAKGVPLRVSGSEGPTGERASLDSELTLLYLDLLGLPRVLTGRIPNPYYARNAGGRFARFSHREFPIYLVTRLDGYDLADIRGLIDRAVAPSRHGRFVLDLKDNDNEMGNNWLREAARRLEAAGVPASRIVLETTKEYLAGQEDVLGYAGWGSNDRSAKSRFLKNTWVNGALLVEFVSSDARTFQKPPPQWNIGKWTDPKETFFKGTPQSLIADRIHEGVTGASGNVDEPFLDACVHPQVLFPAYVSGLNLAESYYAAMPYLSWMGVVVGDPLAAPFSAPALPAEEADPPRDPQTGLPAFFAAHMAKLAKKPPRP